MQNLTPDGQWLVDNISARYGLSPDSAMQMIVAVNNGGGTMAQFSCPELGSGQWMKGGMTMVSDMFNHSLKTTVINLCEEISSALATTQVFPSGQGGGMGNGWWPAELGNPSSSGGQNDSRYAVFPQTRRLAIQRNGQVTVYDTLDNNIGGVGQQQGGSDSLTFSSQYGTIPVSSLPLISGPGLYEAPSTNFFAPPPEPAPYYEPTPAPPPFSPPLSSQNSPQNSPQNPSEILALLEKLGQLHDAGILTDEEFSTKKSELLVRL